MKYIKLLVILLIIISFSGCCKEPFERNISIERDGDISYVYPEDVSNETKNDENLKSVFQDIYETTTYFKTNIEVDNNVYNFMIVFPFKTKTDIKQLFKEAELRNPIPWFDRIDYNLVTEQGIDGYYHYKFYRASNYAAGAYLLNGDIKDYNTFFHLTDDWIDCDTHVTNITTNSLTIQAQEFKELLERLAISYDRLEFQPDGY